ncbi:hypothetical protein [Porticoccus litoralis]|jgi:hypothetical protein|uniref:Uncharacterized protein n=1 Tax=Porticoccus litoralis TaxID=434086 RepID=A0AAW8B4G7_9GAMM|nr:hypothetical protein [Porticoccus litoralis]MDP1521297.1 hypothetical protein [Porticoccus litoralis]TNE95132.1 MAG: hypothetical protein EP324_00535 [Gammaproteobacteria bacterium]
MKRKKEQSIWIRLLRTISSLALIGATTYVIVAGFNLIAAVVLISSFGGIAGPAVMAADSALECVTGFFELLLDGILSIFEIIGDIFSSIFG